MEDTYYEIEFIPRKVYQKKTKQNKTIQLGNIRFQWNYLCFQINSEFHKKNNITSSIFQFFSSPTEKLFTIQIKEKKKYPS